MDHTKSPTSTGDADVRRLEAELAARTRSLEEARWALEEQVARHQEAQAQVEAYQEQLRKLASELSLAEARQRRVIAQELHDQIGQALAFIRMRITRLQGDAVFCGFEDNLEEILRLLGQTINSTRNLTFEISPPVLYELGLASALEWLVERMAKHDDLVFHIHADEDVDLLPEDTRVVLFQAVRELLANVIKHADAREVNVRARLGDGGAQVTVADDGCGFDEDTVVESGADAMTFGLFSIRERLRYLGGSMAVESRPGEGTTVTLTTPVRGSSPEVTS